MWLFIMIYLVVIFFAVDIVFWLVRMVLKPLTELENTAGAISRVTGSGAVGFVEMTRSAR